MTTGGRGFIGSHFVEKILELDPVISRDYFNKPEELKLCLDELSKLISSNIK